MHVEQREPVRPLDQLHRGGVAWVHFDRVREPSPRHEIDPVHPHQPERPGDALGQERRPLEQAVVRGELGIPARPEDAAAVTEPIGSERGLPGENAREPQRHRAAPVCREHQGAGHAGDALLEVAAPRHGRAPPPDGDAVPAPGAQRLHEPSAARARRWPREADAWARQTGVGDHPGEAARVARSGQHGGRVAPEHPVGREGADGAGVVFEARLVHDGLAGHVPRSRRGGAGAEPPVDPDDMHLGRAGLEIEIAKSVDRDHLVPRTDGGLRDVASRHAGEQHARHDKPSRRRACLRGTTYR